MSIRIICRHQSTRHGWVKAYHDGIIESGGVIMLFGSLLGDPVIPECDVLHVFTGAERLKQFGGALTFPLETKPLQS